MTESRTVAAPAQAGRRSSGWPIGIAVGIIAGILGLAPWLVSGERLPLQNLWAEQTLPDDMPWAMIPVNQYYLVTMISLPAMGGLFAGLAGRLLHGPRWASPIGLLLMHGVAAVQSLTVVGGGLNATDLRAQIYLAIMTATVAIGIALAQLICWLATRPGRVGPTLAIGPAAFAVGDWIMRWFWLAAGPTGIAVAITLLLPWIPAVVVGLALGRCGWGGKVRNSAWLLNLLALWVGSAVITAVQVVAGSRALLGQGSEAVYALLQYLLAGLSPMGRGLWLVALALVIALAVMLIRRLTSRPPKNQTRPR